MNPVKIGQDMWKRTEKINAELFAITYGSLVAQLVKDHEDYGEVNIQLDKMGYQIGMRIIEDFLSRSGTGRCSDFREVGEMVAKAGFKMFLNITPPVTHKTNPSEFILTLDENPLTEFVELPEDALGKKPHSQQQASNEPQSKAGDESSVEKNDNSNDNEEEDDEEENSEGLWYSNVLCGVLRGALEMVNYQVEAKFLSDVLRGDDKTELSVRLIKILDEEVPQGEE